MQFQIIVRPKGKEFLVIAKGNDPTTGVLTRFDIIDRFATKELAEKKANLLTHILTRAMKTIPALVVSLLFIVSAYAQTPSPAYLTASWYSIESLKKRELGKQVKE